MKSKFLSVLIILGILAGFAVLPADAMYGRYVEGEDPPYDPVQLQVLTENSIEDMEFIQFWLDDIIYYRVNGFYGAVDIFGRTVLEPVYDSLMMLSNDHYMSVRQNGKWALFHKGRQLTPFCYDEISRMAMCFRAVRNGTNELLDMNGKILPVPNVASGDWTLFDAIPYKALILYEPPKYWIDEDASYDNIVQTSPHYAVYDWNGNVIVSLSYRKILAIDDNCYAYIVDHSLVWKKVYLDPNKVPKTAPEGLSECVETNITGNQYHVLCDSKQLDNKLYYLYDADYNLICQLDIPPRTTVPAFALSEDTFLMKCNSGSAIMNAQGQVLKELPGYFTTFVGIEVCKASYPSMKSETIHTDRFIMKAGGGCYIYDKAGNQIAFLKDAVKCTNEGYYITAELSDGNYAMYDADGNYLFGYTKYSEIKVINGVITQEKNNKIAILDRNGEAITDYLFTWCFKTEAYGVVSGGMDNSLKSYLINHVGEILNDVSYDSTPYFHGTYCAYTINGKTGFVRLVTPGDDLFLDVPAGEWYHDAIEACAKRNLFNGTGAGKFEPEETMTRAMVVTVLWRLDGQKTPGNVSVFSDVPADTWYTEAVAWAAENGIVNGVGDGKFEPDGSVTREQIATIFCRYAESKGIDTAKRADLSSYPDVAEISDYAKEAMAWVNAEGLIIGNKINDTVLLQPQRDATRAQVATIFMRYVNTFVEN